MFQVDEKVINLAKQGKTCFKVQMLSLQCRQTRNRVANAKVVHEVKGKFCFRNKLIVAEPLWKNISWAFQKKKGDRRAKKDPSAEAEVANLWPR